MRARRAERKRNQKIYKIERAKASAEYTLTILEYQLADQARALTDANQPREEKYWGASTDEEPDVPLPMPPRWQQESLQYSDRAATLTEEKLRELTLSQQIPTAIADAGATSNCGMDYESECGRYKMVNPFVDTGRISDKIFQYAGGGLAPASVIKELPMEVRAPANEVHVVPGIKNNLLSTSKFVDANYAWVFDNDVVSIYDKNNTEIKTTRAAVIKGWQSPR